MDQVECLAVPPRPRAPRQRLAIQPAGAIAHRPGQPAAWGRRSARACFASGSSRAGSGTAVFLRACRPWVLCQRLSASGLTQHLRHVQAGSPSGQPRNRGSRASSEPLNPFWPRRGGEREGAARWDADALVARSASGKEAVEKARKTSPVWEPGCLKNAPNSTVAPRGAWHQNSPIKEKRRIPRIPHQASPAACCGCSQQR